MIFKSLRKTLFLIGAAGTFLAATQAQADPDPNFHIYIAYGQSNMAGAGKIRSGIDDVEHPRYKMFATTVCDGPHTSYSHFYEGAKYFSRKTVGEIYPAVPPMFHCGEGLSVADWFGRAMADSLPNVTVGIIPVAVGGTKIELFDKDKYAQYLSGEEAYLVNWAKDYGSDGNAHARIIEVAKEAMKVGVIKGIIFHQGESGAMNGNDWQQEVKKSRDDILKALNLSSDTVPFLAGGLEDRAAGGCCWAFTENNIVTLPNVMDNTYFVSSEGLTGNGEDSFHFNSASYQEFGIRYANVMLQHMVRGPVVITPRTPYGGTAVNIPGKIEAENFDIPGTGSANKTFNDIDSENRGKSTYRASDASSADLYDKATGVILGYNQEGEWFEYTVNVKQAGEYKMTASVATEYSTASFKLSMDENPLTEDISVSGTDFDIYSTVEATVSLQEGKHILRMTVTSSWFDVDFFNFELISAATTTSDSTNTDIDHSLTIPTAFSTIKQAMKNGNRFSLYDLHGKLITRFNAPSMSEAIRMVQGKNKGLHQGVYLIRETSAVGMRQKIILK